MDSDTAARFVSALAQSIQALCHGYVDFHSSIEVIGHIYLNVDNGSKFNYIVNEEVSKFPHNHTNSTLFRTHSYYSVPPSKLSNVSHSCFKDLDAEILVVSKSGYAHKSSKELNATLPIERSLNLTSPSHLPSCDNEQINDFKRQPESSPTTPEVNYMSPKDPVTLFQSNPSRRKRKKSETTKYVNPLTYNDELAVGNNFFNNDSEKICSEPCCDNELLVNNSVKQSFLPSSSSSECKSISSTASSVVHKKRRKSEPSKCVPHLTMKDPETDDTIFILKNEADESYQSTLLESEFSEKDDYAPVKKEIFLNADSCEPFSNCDFKDSLPYSSSRDQDMELIKNSSFNFQRDSFLSDTLNTSISPSTKNITAQLRHQIVEYANIVGNRPAARHFGVHESSIRHWRKRFIYGDAAVKKRKKKKDLLMIEKEIENVQMVESPLSITS